MPNSMANTSAAREDEIRSWPVDQHYYADGIGDLLAMLDQARDERDDASLPIITEAELRTLFNSIDRDTLGQAGQDEADRVVLKLCGLFKGRKIADVLHVNQAFVDETVEYLSTPLT